MRYYQPIRYQYKPELKRQFVCDHPDCEDYADCPQLKDEVWERISTKRGLLCIFHAEHILGRRITLEDLMPCIGNAFTFLLADRLEEKRLSDNNERRILG